MIRSRHSPEIWPLKDEDERNSAYYFIDGESQGETDYSAWTYYDEDFGLGSEKTSGEDENESGHCEDDDFDAEEEYEEEEECEAISMDGSELSQFSAEMSRIKSKTDLVEMVSASLMQQVM